ncbi:MAG TPA: Rrf2 family transcriptional regulator [Kiritimatiellia bacterium]|nr:Rrf2 family transcriptional regulator [Kiritimatiellia bacterium]
MIGLSKTSGYALRAAICLANKRCAHGQISTIADCTGIPAPYLAKIFKRLKSAGLVECRRGPSGGVWLARPASRISVLDICDAIEGVDWLSPCLLGSQICADERACALHAFWERERAAIRKHLSQRFISTMVHKDQPHRTTRRKTSSRRIAA